MKHIDQLNDNMEEENLPPAPFKKWNQVYALVFGNLVLLILLFYWFGISFS